MTDLNKVRFAWLELPIHERILVLKEASKEDKKAEHTWIRQIPHEMSRFDDFFRDYTPTEIFQLKGNSVNGKKYSSHFDIHCAYFLFNPETRVLSSVENIEQTLRDLFDSLLAKIGPDAMITVFKRCQLSGFTHLLNCTVDIPDDVAVGDIVKNGKLFAMELQKEVDGRYIVKSIKPTK